MSYQLTITSKPAYLHAIVTGLNDRENVARYLEEIHRECVARSCKRLLIEERLEGPRLNTMDVFQVASGGSGPAGRYFEAIAYVDVNAKGELMKFAETVATNRAVRVRVFPTVDDAEKWLADKSGSGTPSEGQSAADPPRN